MFYSWFCFSCIMKQIFTNFYLGFVKTDLHFYFVSSQRRGLYFYSLNNKKLVSFIEPFIICDTKRGQLNNCFLCFSGYLTVWRWCYIHHQGSVSLNYQQVMQSLLFDAWWSSPPKQDILEIWQNVRFQMEQCHCF